MIPIWLTKLPLNLIKFAAEAQNVPWDVLAAIAMVESGGNQYAMRYEPLYKYTYRVYEIATNFRITPDTEEVSQKTSVGYCQIMFAWLREHGFNGHFAEAFDAKTNFLWAAKKLRQLVDKYGEVEEDIISAYNQGDNRKEKSGANYQNQTYVNKVVSYLNEIRSGG